MWIVSNIDLNCNSSSFLSNHLIIKCYFEIFSHELQEIQVGNLHTDNCWITNYVEQNALLVLSKYITSCFLGRMVSMPIWCAQSQGLESCWLLEQCCYIICLQYMYISCHVILKSTANLFRKWKNFLYCIGKRLHV